MDVHNVYERVLGVQETDQHSVGVIQGTVVLFLNFTRWLWSSLLRGAVRMVRRDHSRTFCKLHAT